MNDEKKNESASVVGEVKVSNEILSFRKSATTSVNKSSANMGQYSSSIELHESKILTVPANRILAKALNVNLSNVKGTGNKGQILAIDIQNYAKSINLEASIPSSKNFEIGVINEPSMFIPVQNASILNPPFSSPLARAKANELGIEIRNIVGSGPNNRVMLNDVERENIIQQKNAQVNASTTKLSSSNIDTISLESDKREKTTPMRKAIAKAMQTSWNKVAYTNLVLEIDVTKLWDIRNEIKDKVLEQTGVKLTFLPYIIKSIVIALRDYPILNATYDEATDEIVYKNDINMGIAVDTPAGLIVPVIHNADKKNMLVISKELTNLAKLARDKKIKGSDLSNGTFTITNYGSVGALYGVPVINFPQLAIAGVGAIIDKVYFKNGNFVAGKSMHLTVAADHRWIDGAEIGRFASRVKQLLENPATMTLY